MRKFITPARPTTALLAARDQLLVVVLGGNEGDPPKGQATGRRLLSSQR